MDQTCVWVSTQESGVTVLMDFAEIPLQRHGDIELMWLFVKTGWKQLALQVLNHCRMYLQVFLISDIMTGTGSFIASQFWDQPQPVQSRFGWPKTNPPPISSWTLWHEVLTATLHLGQNQKLAVPLGKWLTQSHPNISPSHQLPLGVS